MHEPCLPARQAFKGYFPRNFRGKNIFEKSVRWTVDVHLGVRELRSMRVEMKSGKRDSGKRDSGKAETGNRRAKVAPKSDDADKGADPVPLSGIAVRPGGTNFARRTASRWLLGVARCRS